MKTNLRRWRKIGLNDRRGCSSMVRRQQRARGDNALLAKRGTGMALPAGVRFVVIGAGVHGLSTAYHLALALKAKGLGGGTDILVVDKTGIAAGASGIACGVIRNNYYQPAMRELMAHCVEVWERDPEAYSYHPVGYMQISPERMREQVGTIYEQQQAIGYEFGVHRRRRPVRALHEGHLRRLAGAGHHLGPAREAGRLRQQHQEHLRPRRQGRGRGRANPDRGQR